MEPKEIQAKLNAKASEISKEYGGAPVVVIVAGSKDANIPGCITGRANLGEGREGRMRDLLGILEAAKQIEATNHLR